MLVGLKLSNESQYNLPIKVKEFGAENTWFSLKHLPFIGRVWAFLSTFTEKVSLLQNNLLLPKGDLEASLMQE